jgi:hypothetical protein
MESTAAQKSAAPAAMSSRFTRGFIGTPFAASIEEMGTDYHFAVVAKWLCVPFFFLVPRSLQLETD